MLFPFQIWQRTCMPEILPSFCYVSYSSFTSSSSLLPAHLTLFLSVWLQSFKPQHDCGGSLHRVRAPAGGPSSQSRCVKLEGYLPQQQSLTTNKTGWSYLTQVKMKRRRERKETKEVTTLTTVKSIRDCSSEIGLFKHLHCSNQRPEFQEI